MSQKPKCVKCKFVSRDMKNISSNCTYTYIQYKSKYLLFCLRKKNKEKKEENKSLSNLNKMYK